MARPRGSRNDPNRPQLNFKQCEIERAIRGLHSQGLGVRSVEVEPATGKITVVAADKPSSETPSSSS